MKKTSLEDVAKALGVSKTLVSMVINGKAAHYGISKDTEQKVWKKIEEMGFKPNLTARKLRTGKSNVIGLIVADISNPFYAKIARSIEDTASEYGYHLVICSSDEKAKREAELISILCDQHQVDGLIVSSTLDSPAAFKKLEQQKIPFLLMDREFPKYAFPSVTVDNRKGAEMIVNHLQEMGIKKIGMITLSPSHLSTLKDRFLGYKDALKKHHTAFNSQWLREVTFENMQEEIRKEVAALLSPPLSVQGIFTANNIVALHTLEAIQQMGLRIPQDVALVSFDDIDVFQFTHPPITAISQPLKEIGKTAVDILYKMMQGPIPEKDRQVVLPVSLKVRTSCGHIFRQPR
jgi:LacI family transcriptional regulator